MDDLKCGCGGSVNIYDVTMGVFNQYQKHSFMLICQKCKLRSYIEGREKLNSETAQELKKIYKKSRGIEDD